ncbi:MAG TPA: response regulator [Anaerolineaceae bacterium]|nr:response regulator [Anaerolineaceae bacterium]HNS37646.1 response regulator [Anaerolineaceae bacterium]HOD03679.1 response regulator [Anaerolineaceae bacterium]
MTKILLIEDIPDNAELTCKILVSAGYEVVHAPEAELGMEQAVSVKPDLILLDLGLPDYDGQTLAGWLSADPRTAAIPIVAYTAWPEATARQMVTSYGCAGYIPKPIIKVNDFLSQIASFLKSNQSYDSSTQPGN